MSTTATIPTRREHVAIATEQRTCAQHGAYTSTRWDLQPKPEAYPRLPGRAAHELATFLAPWWSSCPTCDAEAQREVDARDAEIRGGMTERQRMQAARLREAQIPPRFIDSTVWNWSHPMDQQRRVWHVARDYCSDIVAAIASGRSLVMLGATGTGKTHLAIGVLRHVVEKGGTGLYRTAVDLVAGIRATYHRDAARAEAQVIDELVAVDLLVVDEIGRGLDTVHETAQLFRVLDARYRERKPVVLVTNLSQAKLVEALGEALIDRLREGGGALLTFDWASQRSRRQVGSANA